MDRKLRDELTANEREFLAELWEHPMFPKVVKKLAGLKNLQLAQMVFQNSMTHEFTVQERGFGQGVNWFPQVLEEIHKTKKKKVK